MARSGLVFLLGAGAAIGFIVVLVRSWLNR